MKVATQAGGGDFMDYHDAVTAVLEKAARIILPGDSVDVVAAAEREFAETDACDGKFIRPIEQTLSECLQQWTPVQKHAIWRSTEDGQADDADFDECDTQWLDMALEGELMHHILARLSGNRSDDNHPERDFEPW